MAKRRTARTARRAIVRRRAAPPAADHPLAGDPVQTAALRDLFWQNVVREMLTALSAMQEAQPDIFDGRLAVLTKAGERVPIAEVFPMFACGIPGTPLQQAMSVAVECTVFRVRTPDGEVFTLPLHEVRGLHSLTGELLKQLEQQAIGEASTAMAQPFGFAAIAKPPTHPSPPDHEGKPKPPAKRRRDQAPEGFFRP